MVACPLFPTALHRHQTLKIKLEIDTDPPAGFETESRTVLLPTPFAVRVYRRPDLFAGKMHAILCRKWKSRVKGRDWYDLVWYVSHHPQLHLGHLEARMRASGDWTGDAALTRADLFTRLRATIAELDVAQTREETSRFIRDPSVLDIWSPEFFREIAEKIETV